MTAPSASTAGKSGKYLVLFDGDCTLCNGWARFISARDPRCQFALGSLQSPRGLALLREHGLGEDLSSIVLIAPDGPAEKSDAVLRIASRLSGAWPLLGLFRLVPRALRDLVYDFVARNRYRWFGKQDENCPLPTPEMRARLID